MKTWKDIKEAVDNKIFEIKWKVSNGVRNAIKWCEENKELAIAMIPVGIVAVKGISNTIRSVDRKIDLKKEQDLQDLYIYDHSLGMYLKLRRPLKPSEKIEIDRRRKEGESKIQILSSMGLLD